MLIIRVSNKIKNKNPFFRTMYVDYLITSMYVLHYYNSQNITTRRKFVFNNVVTLLNKAFGSSATKAEIKGERSIHCRS